MWSISEQRHILPDLEVATNIINKLNAEFDSRDLYHHSHSPNEMFKFKFSLASSRSECWEITFLGYCVASGNMFGADYEECIDEQYININLENEQRIYEMAYNGAIDRITNILEILSFSDVEDKQKKKWMLTLGKNLKTN